MRPVVVFEEATSSQSRTRYSKSTPIAASADEQFADMADRANDGGAYSGLSWTSGLRVGWP